MASSWRQKVFDLGWSHSGFELIARVVDGPPPFILISKYWNGFEYEILSTVVPEQPSETWMFSGLITPEMRFPYGYRVFPDQPV